MKKPRKPRKLGSSRWDYPAVITAGNKRWHKERYEKALDYYEEGER